MGRLIWTAEAESWLREIHGFIAQDQPEAALKVIQGLLQKAQTLRDHPPRVAFFDTRRMAGSASSRKAVSSSPTKSRPPAGSSSWASSTMPWIWSATCLDCGSHRQPQTQSSHASGNPSLQPAGDGPNG